MYTNTRYTGPRLSVGRICNAKRERMHRWRGEKYIVRPRYVVDNAFILAQQARGIFKPVVARSVHDPARQEPDEVPVLEDGIWVRYRTRDAAGNPVNLPYGVCGCCGFQIPKNYCATWVRKDGPEIDLCISCVPGDFRPAELFGGDWSDEEYE